MGTRSLQASQKGIEKANLALAQYSLSQNALAKDLGLSRQTVNNFFKGKAIDRENFALICDRLILDLKDTVAIVDAVADSQDLAESSRCDAQVWRIHIPENLPKTHVRDFVGRSKELAQLQKQLQQANHLAITAISGMGGIGKTELALQYALHHLRHANYKGGVCWLRARESEIGTQIITFVRSQLGLDLPDRLDLNSQVNWCWQHWREGEVLVILDDVTDYSVIQPYLPPYNSRFKVLITTRLRLSSFQHLELQELDEAAALQLLVSLTNSKRINYQLEAAQQLCHWLGYLPLGLELAGRYLAQKPDLLLAGMLDRLQQKRLKQTGLVRNPNDRTWTLTAQHGIAAAFELSWQELNNEAQELCYLLSLFALAPINWCWVERCLPSQDYEKLEDIRDQYLIQFSLLQRIGECTYRIHPLIREFYQAKVKVSANSIRINQLNRAVCRFMVEISKTVSEAPTLAEIAHLTPTIPHLKASAQNLIQFYSNKDLMWAFNGLALFYWGRGFYDKVEFWCTKGKEILTQRLGENHLDVAQILNNLAQVYRIQGRYNEAEPLYQKSIEIREQQLGQEHLLVAESLNNLARFHSIQGNYEKAESLCRRALKIQERQLGQEHLRVSVSLHLLAQIRSFQKQYMEAKSLCYRAFKVQKKILGKDHPYIAITLSLIAQICLVQGQLKRAQSLCNQVLEIQTKQLGQNHPDLAISLNLLADVYFAEKQYHKAESLYFQALTIIEQRLGDNHPDAALVRENLQASRDAIKVNEKKQLNS